MIVLAATLVTIAIMLGVVWRIYKFEFSSAAPAYRMAAEIEAQLRRLKPPSWMQRRFGIGFWNGVGLTLIAAWAVLTAIYVGPDLVRGIIFIIVGSFLAIFEALGAMGPMGMVVALLFMIYIKLDSKK